jgi:DNA-binding helix-hairpin-helix protein with protein kinase domain
MPDLYDATGRPVTLGRKVGSGGEGAVFDVTNSQAQGLTVAKVYHQPLSRDHQDKIRGMAANCDSALKTVAAWPVTTLHRGPGGEVVGFLMPKVCGHEPIHKLYSAAHRKQLFPRADWAFLVHAARNLAAAFDAIHAHGHVIGDVNEQNVVVGADSTIKLIDCDSFQINAQGRSFLCEVGVVQFTPPELQNHTFRGVRRTPNHDRFGLAVLCFHLLFMGRHPFAGVYTGKDIPMERAIEQFRFAYGQRAAQRGLSPPPKCPKMAIIPRCLADLFELAFSDSGTSARPSAAEWVRLLGDLEGNLQACRHHPTHKFYRALSECPWCTLERTSGVVFFIALARSLDAQNAFNLTAVWAQITAIAPPGPPPSIDPTRLAVVAAPLPKELADAKRSALYRRIVGTALVFVGIALSFLLPIAGGIGLVGGLVVFFWPTPSCPERRRRISAFKQARNSWNQIQTRWRMETGDGPFQKEVAELSAARTAFERVRVELDAEKQRLFAARQERQLHRFLDGFHLDDHKIPDIGPGLKAALASFGIETAADIDRQKIHGKIPGFKDVRTNRLVQWRQHLEAKFVFDPTKGIDANDLGLLNQRYGPRLAPLEHRLARGAQTLNHLKGHALAQRKLLWNDYESAAQRLAQASADARILGGNTSVVAVASGMWHWVRQWLS